MSKKSARPFPFQARNRPRQRRLGNPVLLDRLLLAHLLLRPLQCLLCPHLIDLLRVLRCIEASSTDQIQPMIKHNLGIGFLPDVLAQKALQKQEIFELKLDCSIPRHRICLVKDTSRTMSIAARELEKTLM